MKDTSIYFSCHSHDFTLMLVLAICKASQAIPADYQSLKPKAQTNLLDSLPTPDLFRNKNCWVRPVMPHFPCSSECSNIKECQECGKTEMLLFIQKNLKYPLPQACVEGSVILEFKVRMDGSLSDFKVLRSLHKAFDEEAIRVIKMMPPWIPGQNHGEFVEILYRIPIKYTLHAED